MASRTVQDPEPLRDQQQRLRVSRTIVSDSSTSLRRTSESTQWLGRTASRVKNGVRRSSSALSRVGGEIDVTIHQIERHIQWMEQQRTELAGIERRIRAWMTSNPVGTTATSGQPDASIVGPLPPRFSPAWRTLSVRLRRSGAIF